VKCFWNRVTWKTDLRSMQSLSPTELASFARRYRFAGAILRSAHVVHRGPNRVAVELRISVRQALKDLGAEPKRLRLKLRLEGVEEYRLQMRPNLAKVRIADARFGNFSGLFFVNLDAWGLEPGEVPKAHDYRASEMYAAGRELWWEETK